MNEEDQKIRLEIIGEMNAISENIKSMQADNVVCEASGKTPKWSMLDFMQAERDYRYEENELRQIEG